MLVPTAELIGEAGGQMASGLAIPSDKKFRLEEPLNQGKNLLCQAEEFGDLCFGG